MPFGNNNIQYYDFTSPVLSIISDTEGADKVCARSGSHNLQISRHCRTCNVNSPNLDNERCNSIYQKFHDMYNIALNGSQDERKLFSQHAVFNAFYNANFCGQIYGLLCFTPPNILHVIRKELLNGLSKLY